MSVAKQVIEKLNILEDEGGGGAAAPAAPAAPVGSVSTLGKGPDGRIKNVVSYQGRKYNLLKRLDNECTLEDEDGKTITAPSGEVVSG